VKLAPRRVMQPAPGCVLRPVVALDIDGTLGLYHEHFLHFAAMYLQRNLPSVWDGSMPFWRLLGTSKTMYRQVKLAYRQGGMKRSMPVVPGAPELTRAVRAAGAEVWVCTTRPYLRLDNIDPDTRFWLRHNGFQYDGVLFGERKYYDLAQLVGSNRVVTVLDDEPEQCERAVKAGLTATLMCRPYNRKVVINRAVVDIQHATDVLLDELHEWRIERGV
jgi:hypothetical protein